MKFTYDELMKILEALDGHFAFADIEDLRDKVEGYIDLLVKE